MAASEDDVTKADASGVKSKSAENGGGENSKEAKSAPAPHIDVARYKIAPGAPVHLDKIDTHSKGDFAGDKESSKPLFRAMRERLAKLQEVFYAQNKHRLLIILQAMDTGGKDGTISHVFGAVNPQGVEVVSFKAPTPVELAHDYLWRVHPHVPSNGEITIFNRSHYEDVLIVRVHQLVADAVWKRRYEHIRDFEKMLADEGTTILKFYLHISKDEQKARLQSRLNKPSKHWKFNQEDLNERKLWSQYQRAYEEAIQHTTSDYAPWYVIPADRKWYRNLVVAQTVIETIEGLKPTYPKPKIPVKDIVIE